MTNLRVLRGTALSAGIAAGLFGLVAFAPSAFAQYNKSPYWNGAPSATGPTGGPGYGYYYNGPFYGGWNQGYDHVGGELLARRPWAPRTRLVTSAARVGRECSRPTRRTADFVLAQEAARRFRFGVSRWARQRRGR